jgi:hypothetical protein
MGSQTSLLFSGFRGLFAWPGREAGYSRRTSAHIGSYGVHKHRVLEDSYTRDKNSFPFSFEIILWLFLIVLVFLHLFTIAG